MAQERDEARRERETLFLTIIHSVPLPHLETERSDMMGDAFTRHCHYTPSLVTVITLLFLPLPSHVSSFQVQELRREKGVKGRACHLSLTYTHSGPSNSLDEGGQ